MPVRFDVDGPHVIPRTQRPGGSVITREDIAAFWAGRPDIAEACGCYVFGVRNGRGTLPGYVGKAANSFSREVFQPHKLNNYHQYLAHTRKGTPVLFFLIVAKTRGRLNERAILECEQELIMMAKRTNPDLTNIKGTREPAFIIPHVTDPARGRPSKSSLELCQTLGLDTFDHNEDQSETLLDHGDDSIATSAGSETEDHHLELGDTYVHQQTDTLSN